MSHNRGDSLAAYAALHPGSRFEIFVVARGLNYELLRGMSTLPAAAHSRRHVIRCEIRASASSVLMCALDVSVSLATVVAAAVAETSWARAHRTASAISRPRLQARYPYSAMHFREHAICGAT